MTDKERIDFLESLLTRAEYQNARRPNEPLGADMHFNGGRGASLYLRDLCAVVTAEGSGATVRECIDRTIEQVLAGKDDAVRKSPRIKASWHIGGKRPVDQTASYKRKRAALRDGGGES